MEHGGDLLTYEKHYQGELVDFSSNINPLGMPKGLEEVLINSFKSLEAYPDIKYRNLKKSVANYLKCKEEHILLGNGAVEVINNFIILAKRVILMIPSFSEYEKRALAHGKIVQKISYKNEQEIDLTSLEDILCEGDLLVLGNPNNPTGLRIERDTLLKIYEIINRKNAYLLLDEAFYEFCPADYDSIELFKNNNYKNVGIIRAATKFFALPGIRLGYACASETIVNEISKIELPWSINSLADAAGQFIFQDKEYIEKSKEYIEKERNYLLEELNKIYGIEVYNTHTNYILIKILNWNEEFVFNFFLKRGIVIRKCSSFNTLENHIRVAIKDRNNNHKLIQVFKELESTYEK